MMTMIVTMTKPLSVTTTKIYFNGSLLLVPHILSEGVQGSLIKGMDGVGVINCVESDEEGPVVYK